MHKPVKSSSLFWSRILVSVLALIAIAGVTYAVNNPPPRPIATPPPFPINPYHPLNPTPMQSTAPALPLVQTYSNTSQGFTLKLPNSWSTNEQSSVTNGNKSYILKLTSPQRKLAWENAREDVQSDADFSIVIHDELADLPFYTSGDTLEEWSHNYPSTNIVFTGTQTIDGKTAYMTKQTYPDRSTEEVSCYIQVGDRVFVIRPHVRDEYQDQTTGEAILSSLTFIK